MATIRGVVSRGATQSQLSDEIASLSQEERQQLIAAKDFCQPISAADTLAMKADLVVPWNKLRIMRR